MRITFLLSIFVLTLAVACKKDTKLSQTVDEILSSQEESTSGEIIIKAEAMASGNGDQDIDLQGTFYDNNGTMQQVNSFSVNGVEVEEFHERFYYRSISALRNEDEYSKLNDIWGSSTEVSVNSPEFGDFTEEVRFPELISIESMSVTNQELSKSTDLAVSWRASSNPDETKVTIFVTYEGNKSNSENPDLPAENIVIMVEAEDNGEAVVPADRLASLPVGGTVTVTVVRTITATPVQLENGNSVNIQPLSLVHSDPFVVVE